MIIARTGARPPGALSLAGSSVVWYEPQPGEADQADLSTVRSPICGLTMDRPRIMGILNVTPDSFSDGGTLDGVAAAVGRAAQMAEASDILDVGGESTRPGAEFVSVREEIERTAPVIRAIRDAGISTPISIDTRKAAVAEAAISAGADMVNDVSALTFDSDMAGLVAEAAVPICLMHAKGTPDTMQSGPRYDDVMAEVMDHLAERIDFAAAAGIPKARMITDPGIGFGKTLQHNMSLLRGLADFHSLGCPILLGASRKRFIGTISGEETASERSPGSIAVALHGVSQGVQILRVHDTAQTKQALGLQMAILED